MNWIRLKRDIQDAGQRADHQRFGEARHAFQQAVAAGEDGGKQLLDHLVLADDDLLQLLLHHLPMLGEFLQDIAEGFGLGGLVDMEREWSRGQESGVRDQAAVAAGFHQTYDKGMRRGWKPGEPQ